MSKTDDNSDKNIDSSPHQPFDAYFRTSMQIHAVAKEFLLKELPTKLSRNLDFSSLKERNNSYIDPKLQSTFSDMCFDCQYNQEILNELASNDNKTNKQVDFARIIILIEHQSKPDKFMPFRMFHYLMNALYKEFKGRDANKHNNLLPAIYPVIYYHGDQTNYPYSLNFIDGFYDPVGIMNDVFSRDILLVNINQYTDDEILENPLLAFLNGLLKHTKKSRNKNYHGLDEFFLRLS